MKAENGDSAEHEPKVTAGSGSIEKVEEEEGQAGQPWINTSTRAAALG